MWSRLNKAEHRTSSILKDPEKLKSVKDFENFYKIFKNEVRQKKPKFMTIKLRFKKTEVSNTTGKQKILSINTE